MSRIAFEISNEPGFDKRTAYWLARLSVSSLRYQELIFKSIIANVSLPGFRMLPV